MAGHPAIECVGLDGPLADLVSDRTRVALAALGLAADLDRLVLCADDLAAGDQTAGDQTTGDQAWYGAVSGKEGAGRGVTLYCHPGAFLTPRPDADPPGPPSAVWERSRLPAPDPPPTAAEFACGRADVFLHHHLLTIRDLLRRELVPSLLPGASAEAFAAAWAIGVDGRLARAGLPGHDLAECRRRFSRLFCQAGILMPEHWQVFQSLWDGTAGQQRDVQRLVRRLPRL